MKNLIAAIIALILTVVAFQLLMMLWHGLWILFKVFFALGLGLVIFYFANQFVQKVLD